MTQRLFFAMMQTNCGTLEPTLYHDEFFPNEHDRKRVIYATQVQPPAQLRELEEEFYERSKDGTLAPTIAPHRW